MNAKAIEDLHQLIRETPSLFLLEIGEWLALHHDLPISIAALHDNLWELGLTYKLLLRKAAAEWADQSVVLDELSKDGKTMLRRYGRALSGEDPFVGVTLDRGIRYSILPALTVDSYLAVQVVEGSIDGAEFYDFVVNDIKHYAYRQLFDA